MQWLLSLTVGASERKKSQEHSKKILWIIAKSLVSIALIVLAERLAGKTLKHSDMHKHF